MNGSTGARRCARPARITLARVLDGDIDAAWWPHSASAAGELPGLIGALHRPLGEIVDIKINWSPTDAAPDLDSMGLSCPVRSVRCRPAAMRFSAAATPRIRRPRPDSC